MMLERLQKAKQKSRASQNSDIKTQDYTSFKHQFWHNYDHVEYQSRIDAVLMQIADYLSSDGERGIKKAMFFLPPRHGKTQNISRLFPAWLLSQTPHLRVISASYGATLAYRNSRIVRNLIRDPRYQQLYPHVSLADDSQAVDQWDIAQHGGGLIAAGVGGGVTGHGANLIIIDDPIKSRAEAESETYRRRLHEWYSDDLLTRLEEPGGAIILMQTRWHTDDLAGYLLNAEPGEWHVLSFPALAVENDPLGRAVGEPLWKERYTSAILEKRKSSMGEYSFAALYQQNPIPSGGGLFKTENIRIVDAPPHAPDIVRFYDLAITAKKHSDYTAGIKMGMTSDNQFVILDLYHVQKEAPDVERGIIQNALIDTPSTRIRLEAEKAGIMQLQYLLRNPELNPYSLDAKAPEGDKYTRAAPFASRVNAGMVYMARGHWNRKLLDELATFPLGQHDDIVDACSGAYEMLSSEYGKITSLSDNPFFD